MYIKCIFFFLLSIIMIIIILCTTCTRYTSVYTKCVIGAAEVNSRLALCESHTCIYGAHKRTGRGSSSDSRTWYRRIEKL